ncbi:MAG: signal peptide peptidase SppA [Acidobacteriia bacterium]|nr:signal peptide peptidase SppA [Terriglobia bacterium]
MDNKKSRVWLWVLLGGGVFMVFVLAIFILVYASMSGGGDETISGSGFGDKIGVIEVEGVILDTRPAVNDIKRFSEDDSIKAIILHINTPGGGAAASQEIYDAVRRVRDVKKKQIVASIASIGASGGYYIASGSNRIYANRSSIVGSIGVIAEWVNYGDLMKWARLKDVTLKAGSLKDAGSPSREMTPEERAYLQSLIDDMHQQFIHDVAEGRHLKEDQIRPIANGRVWTGQQALSLKLIDQLADFQTVVDETAKSVGIRGEPTLVRPPRQKHTLLEALGGDVSQYLPDKAKLMQHNPEFYFLWK